MFRSTQYTPIRKKQQDEYFAKTMFEFSCQTFCILRSREKVIQAHCFVGLEKYYVVAGMGIENSI